MFLVNLARIIGYYVGEKIKVEKFSGKKPQKPKV